MRQIYIFFLLTLIVPSLSQAQWQVLPGPNGGVVQSMTITPQGNVLAAQYAGSILYSTDAGVSWNDAWRDFWTTNVVALTTAPHGTVFAASYNGLYRSADGLVWEKTGFLDIPTSLTFTAQGYLLVGTRGNVQVSEDDGQSWRLSVPIAGTTRSFKVAVADDDTWFAGAYQVGIARSSDRGITWQRIDAALPSTVVYSLSMVDGTMLFAGLANATYFSDDHGEQWQHAGGLDGINVYRVQRISPSRLVAETSSGLYASDDQGMTWYRFAAATISNVSAVLVRDSALVLAAADGSLLRSSDQGKNWVRSDDGMPIPAISNLHVTDSGSVFAASLVSGLYRSEDEGQNWVYADSTYRPFAAMDIYAARDGGIYVLTQDDGLRRSDDGGVSWVTLPDPGSGYDISALAENQTLLLAADFGGSIHSSTDRGATWEERSVLQPVSGRVSRVQLLVRRNSEDNDILAATDRGLFLSSDGGATWRLQPVAGINRDLIVLHETVDGSLLAASYRDVYLSRDSGMTWSEVYSSSSQGIKGLMASNRNGDIFIADDALLYRSENLGATWTSMMAPVGLSALTMDDDGFLYAGTDFSGLYRSIATTLSADAPALAASDVALLGLSPQPATSASLLRIDYTLDRASNLLLTVHDMTGRRIMEHTLGQQSIGAYHATLPVAKLAPGSYMLSLHAGTAAASSRIFIVR